MKKFILGFITGGIICAAVTGFAVEYAVTANPYPVLVDGQEVDIEGYNINDSTYFKLRDVADAVGGFDVDFVDNAITIDTQADHEAASTPVPFSNSTAVNTSELNEDGTRKYTIDGLLIDYINGTGYVSVWDIEKTYNILAIIDSSVYDKNGNIILENVKTDPTDSTSVELMYYENILYPFLIKLSE